MELITDRIEDYLSQLEVSSDYGLVDSVEPYSDLDKLESVAYGLAYKLDTGQPYKGRKLKFDDLLFVYGFAPNIRSAYYLRKKIIKHLDMNNQTLTNSNFLFYNCRFRNKEATPKLNKTLQLYEVVLSFDIRWEEL